MIFTTQQKSLRRTMQAFGYTTVRLSALKNPKLFAGKDRYL